MKSAFHRVVRLRIATICIVVVICIVVLRGAMVVLFNKPSIEEQPSVARKFQGTQRYVVCWQRKGLLVFGAHDTEGVPFATASARAEALAQNGDGHTRYWIEPISPNACVIRSRTHTDTDDPGNMRQLSSPSAAPQEKTPLKDDPMMISTAHPSFKVMNFTTAVTPSEKQEYAHPLTEAPHLFDPEVRGIFRDKNHHANEPVQLQLMILLRQWLSRQQSIEGPKAGRMNVEGTIYQLQCLLVGRDGEMEKTTCANATHILMGGPIQGAK